MNDNVILNVGDKKFLLTPEEAFQIANILCGASRIAKDWIDRDKSSAWVIGEPDMLAATITPFTAHLQIECEANRRYKEEKEKKS
jgi:hypothetical protein